VSRGYGVPGKLSNADKFDLQQYITRYYGSLTMFNILFKNENDQFRAKPRAAQWQAEQLSQRERTNRMRGRDDMGGVRPESRNA
jgi:hypothetical protein